MYLNLLYLLCGTLNAIPLGKLPDHVGIPDSWRFLFLKYHTNIIISVAITELQLIVSLNLALNDISP